MGRLVPSALFFRQSALGRIRYVMLSCSVENCGEPDSGLCRTFANWLGENYLEVSHRPRNTTRPSARNHTLEARPGAKSASTSKERPPLLLSPSGKLAPSRQLRARAVATAPVPHARVSSSTPRSYVLKVQGVWGSAECPTKFTFAPSGPSWGWDRRTDPRRSRSTRATSST